MSIPAADKAYLNVFIQRSIFHALYKYKTIQKLVTLRHFISIGKMRFRKLKEFVFYIFEVRKINESNKYNHLLRKSHKYKEEVI